MKIKSNLLLFQTFTILWLASCQPNDSQNDQEVPSVASEDEQLVEDKPKESTINRIVFSVKPDLDSVLFIGQDLCGQSLSTGPTRFLNEDTFDLYGRDVPYEIEKSTVNDSIHFSFKIINDCCYKPLPAAAVVKDSLLIFPSYDGDSPCDCFCDYSFHFVFPKSDYKNKKIGIRN